MKVNITRRAEKDLINLDPELRIRIYKALYKLRDGEVTFKKLKGLENTRRLRVGDYRIVFEVDEIKKVIYIRYIKHRKEVYRDI